MTFASRTTSATVEARRVFDGVRGLAFHDTDGRANRPPRCDHVTMSLGGCFLRGGDDRAALTIGKFGELAHELCVLLGGIRRRSHRRSMAPEDQAGKVRLGITVRIPLEDSTQAGDTSWNERPRCGSYVLDHLSLQRTNLQGIVARV
jgi:hypothetical protein